MDEVSIIRNIVKICIAECKKKHNINQIDNYILSPLVEKVIEHIKPYIITTIIFFIIMFMLIVSTIVLLITQIIR
jgi:hypothetical protein